MNEKDFEVQNIFGKGGANTAYAKYFTGNSFLNPVKKNWQQNLDKKINFFVTFHAQIPEALYGETYPSELCGLSLL